MADSYSRVVADGDAEAGQYPQLTGNAGMISHEAYNAAPMEVTIGDRTVFHEKKL